MLTKIRDMKFGLKIISALLGLVFMGLTLTGVVAYRSLSHDLEMQLGERLDHIARTAQLLINPKDHEALVARFLKQEQNLDKTPEFKRLQKTLQIIKERNHLEDEIYTVIAPDWAPGNMIFMAMSAEKTYIGNGMTLHPLVGETLKTNSFNYSALYSDHEGSWVSAFAPILDSSGRPAAVFEIDFNATGEVRNAKITLLKTLLFPALISLALAALLGRKLGRLMSRPIEELASATALVAAGKLDARVKVTSRDELGQLGTGFNAMTADLKNQRQQLQDYAQNLEKKVSERTAELADANRSIRGMVNSVTQGFFMFGNYGTVNGIFSAACVKLFGISPVGKHVAEVLRVTDDERPNFDQWLQLVFQDAIPFEDLVGLAPQNMETSDGRYITFKYFPLRNEDGSLSQVVTVASDDTAVREANRRADREKAFASLLMNVTKHQKQFLNFLTEFSPERLNEQVAQNPTDAAHVFRVIHTLKSAAASFQFKAVAEYSHHFEEDLGKIRDAKAPVDQDMLKQRMTELCAIFEEGKLALEPVLGNKIKSTSAWLELPLEDMEGFAKKLRASGVDPNLSNEFVVKFLREPIHRYLTHLNEITVGLAQRLGKEIQPLEVKGGELLVYAKPYQTLFSSLTHAVRNSMDHGIETPEERLAAGKPTAGSLMIEVNRSERAKGDSEAWIEIKLVDDGRGISADNIRKAVQDKGLSFPLDRPDDEVIQYVFEAGFSTKSQVTDLSGRGVGMDAIKTAAVAMGGTCKIMSRPGKGTALVIRVPELSVV